MTFTKKAMTQSNPFVDVSAFLFLEDIADKQGEAGMNNYLISLASSLARSMPEEEYDTWEEFLAAITSGESILTAFEIETITPTENCMVSVICPYTKGLKEYTKRIGELSQVHFNVAEYYNHNVKPGALTTCCVICQSFRNFACERISVAGKTVKYAQLSNVLFNGTHKVAPDEWLPILLEKGGISKTKLNMLQRSNDCIWLVYLED